MDSCKTGKMHQQAKCYVCVLWLRNVVLKLPRVRIGHKLLVVKNGSLVHIASVRLWNPI